MFVCRHPTLGLRVGSVGRNFFILLKVSLDPRALPLFDISLVAGKRTFIRDHHYNIQIRLWVINTTREYDVTSEPGAPEALQNALS